MASAVAIGAGVAVAAFLVSVYGAKSSGLRLLTSFVGPGRTRRISQVPGRRRSPGQGILQGRIRTQDDKEGSSVDSIIKVSTHSNLCCVGKDRHVLTSGQGRQPHKGQGTEGTSHSDVAQPSRPWRKPVSCDEGERSQRVPRKGRVVNVKRKGVGCVRISGIGTAIFR